MGDPIKELIIGNITGALGVENCPSENECNKQDTNETEIKQVNNEVDENSASEVTTIWRYTNVYIIIIIKMNDDKEQNETQPSTGIGGAEIPTNKDNQHGEITSELKESNDCEQTAAVQTRAMKEEESKPKKPLKVTVITGLNIGPKQLNNRKMTKRSSVIGNWFPNPKRVSHSILPRMEYCTGNMRKAMLKDYN